MFNSEQKKRFKIFNRRSFILLSLKLGLFSLVTWKLFDIQILQSKKYKTLSKKNQINFEILYPIRGEILDRNNIIIALNKNTYDLFLIPEQSPNIEETLNKLNDFITISFKTRRKVIELSNKVKKFQRVKILKNINWDDLENIEANKNYLPGLHLQLVPQRIYPYNKYFSHILGYISQPSEEEIQLPYITNMPTLDIGKTGIEKKFNKILIGLAGKREIEVNAFGREIREISRISSQKGDNINISIDSRVQTFVQKELSKHKAGSVVLIDVNSGEILSMVSVPDFDPNLIIKKPNKIYWNTLLNNSLSPLLNRSIQGLYAPGSTFKMIVALSGLQKGVIDSKKSIFCNGKIEFGGQLYHCWKTKGHGKVNIIKAIKESCDCFFYELALKIGIEDIAKTAKEFGLGAVSEIGFENEKKGIVPSIKWKKENKKENWYAGETLTTGIGQGYLLATPLQLSLMTARIANNGKKIQPILYDNLIKNDFNKINFSPKHMKLVKNSMNKVVNEPGGTAYKSRSSNYIYAGKTGTSQVKKITLEERESEDFRKKEKEWKNKDHALFVGYMPADNPRYAISVVIEHGGSGSSAAAPIAKKIFDFIYMKKI